MIDAPPPPAARIHNLVLNVRSFTSLARQVWGGDAALVTLQIDTTLIRIDKARRGPIPKLTREITTLERRDAQYGIACMCIGFGQAIAGVVERL